MTAARDGGAGGSWELWSHPLPVPARETTQADVARAVTQLRADFDQPRDPDLSPGWSLYLDVRTVLDALAAAQAERDALAARVRELEADAARLGWLAHHYLRASAPGQWVYRIAFEYAPGDDPESRVAALRARLDAAREVGT